MMIDYAAEGVDDQERFLNFFPVEGDVTLQILKGHLLMEELLRELIDAQLAFPEALRGNNGTSFDCHQVICLVEALTPVSQAQPWVWLAAKKLNRLRNALAHHLEPKGIDAKVESFVAFVKGSNAEFENDIEAIVPEHGSQLVVSIVAVCAALSSLKTLAQHVRKGKLRGGA